MSIGGVRLDAKETIKALLEASEDGTITAEQVTQAGLHRSVLQELVKSGELYRFGRGLYVRSGIWEDELYLLQRKCCGTKQIEHGGIGNDTYSERYNQKYHGVVQHIDNRKFHPSGQEQQLAQWKQCIKQKLPQGKIGLISFEQQRFQKHGQGQNGYVNNLGINLGSQRLVGKAFHKNLCRKNKYVHQLYQNGCGINRNQNSSTFCRFIGIEEQDRNSQSEQSAHGAEHRQVRKYQNLNQVNARVPGKLEKIKRPALEFWREDIIECGHPYCVMDKSYENCEQIYLCHFHTPPK